MNYDTAYKIYKQIETTKEIEFKEDLIKSAARYARIRVDWYLSDIEKQKEMDQSRTLAHNALIDACNILSRCMAKAEEDVSWRELIGNDRKDIGDFACYLHCIIGLKAR